MVAAMSGGIKVDYSDYRRSMETARERLERWLENPEAPPAFATALEQVKACLDATAELDQNYFSVNVQTPSQSSAGGRSA